MLKLKDALDKQIDKLSNIDPKWRQFVVDHKRHLLSSGTILSITDEDRSRYLFKLDNFLRDRKVHPSLIWVVKVINDLEMDDDFTKRSELVIPNYSTIAAELYRRYQTSSVAKKVVI